MTFKEEGRRAGGGGGGGGFGGTLTLRIFFHLGVRVSPVLL